MGEGHGAHNSPLDQVLYKHMNLQAAQNQFWKLDNAKILKI